MHSPALGYGLQLASFNGLYTLLPPASADAFPVWQKQPVAQEEDQEEGAEGESSGDATEEAPNREGQQQRFLYCDKDDDWLFNCENTPDKTVCWAIEKTGAAAGLLQVLPMGAGMGWRVFTEEVDGKEVFKDMSLTLEPAERSS